MRWRACIGLVLAAALASPGCSTEPDAGSPNVLFILIDTLRADRLDALRNGVPVMPKLRAFADESLHFRKAVSQSSWTKPAMMSIFTGVYPDVHQVELMVAGSGADGSVITHILPESFETFAEYLKGHGYATAAIQSNAVMMNAGAEQGFDEYMYEAYPSFTADEVTLSALRKATEAEGPFVLYAHYTDPHAPYQPPEAYRELFGPLPEITAADESLLAEWNQYYFDRVYHDAGLEAERSFGELSRRARERLRYLYDGECRFIDDQVARLIEFVLRHHPNTLVVITSDHGEEFWEHGSIGHGKTLYEEVVHVPLVVHGPGISPKTVENVVETVGILPTIAAYLGFPARREWQGRNLLEMGKGTDDAIDEAPAFSRTRTSRQAADIRLESVRSGDWKLIHSGTPKRVDELFDLADDPQERTNLVSGRPRHVEDLRSILDRHADACKGHVLAGGAAELRSLDPEIKAKIEALGYAGVPDD